MKGMRLFLMAFMLLILLPFTIVAQTIQLALEPDDALVFEGGTVTVTWGADWADRCMASGLWLGLRPTSGSEDVGPIEDTGELSLTCFSDSTPVTETRKIEVATGPEIEPIIVTGSVRPGASRRPGAAGRLGSQPPELYIAVDVFYGTDRAYKRRDRYSDDEWSANMEYGLAQVSIPESHRPGELEQPVWWKLQFQEDPTKHVMLRDLERLRKPEEFFGRLRSAVSNAEGSEVFIFVHGFNVAFEDALRRTAQLVYDLRLPAVPVTYSWPSDRPGVFSYTTAENNAMKTIPHFMEFVESIRSEAGVTTVNVLAHSMGNRIVVESMENFAQSGVSAPLHHVLLAAPDIDAELFKRAIVPALASSASTTMYVSDADKALQASSEVHGSPRAGSQIILISGMETIDASGVDSDVLGHSYYGAATLIQDVFYLLHEGFGANERGLELRMNADGDYWALPR